MHSTYRNTRPIEFMGAGPLQFYGTPHNEKTALYCFYFCGAACEQGGNSIYPFHWFFGAQGRFLFIVVALPPAYMVKQELRNNLFRGSRWIENRQAPLLSETTGRLGY